MTQTHISLSLYNTNRHFFNFKLIYNIILYISCFKCTRINLFCQSSTHSRNMKLSKKKSEQNTQLFLYINGMET